MFSKIHENKGTVLKTKTVHLKTSLKTLHCPHLGNTIKKKKAILAPIYKFFICKYSKCLWHYVTTSVSIPFSSFLTNICLIT